MSGFWQSLWDFMNGAEQAPVPVRRRLPKRPRVERGKRTYPDVLGQTACDILEILSRHSATGVEISQQLSTQSAGMHLPRLRELDLITVADGRRPFIYQITEKGRIRLAGKTEYGA